MLKTEWICFENEFEKLQKERLEYEANKAQRSDQNKKDEEKMKKNLLVRKKTEESEKKRYREETIALNKLQHRCSDAKAEILKTKEQFTTSSNQLMRAQDRLDDTSSAVRSKMAQCEALNNQTATIRAKGASNINGKRANTYDDVKEVVESEKILNATETEYKTMLDKINELSKNVDVLGAQLSEATKARQISQVTNEKNLKLKCPVVR